jgi:hypothetical protein
MMPKEKHLAAVRRLKEPLLYDCRDRAVINPENTLEFVCPNKHEVSGKCICLNVYLYVCVLIYSLLVLWIYEVSFEGVALWS